LPVWWPLIFHCASTQREEKLLAVQTIDPRAQDEYLRGLAACQEAFALECAKTAVNHFRRAVARPDRTSPLPGVRWRSPNLARPQDHEGAIRRARDDAQRSIQLDAASVHRAWHASVLLRLEFCWWKCRARCRVYGRCLRVESIPERVPRPTCRSRPASTSKLKPTRSPPLTSGSVAPRSGRGCRLSRVLRRDRIRDCERGTYPPRSLLCSRPTEDHVSAEILINEPIDRNIRRPLGIVDDQGGERAVAS
jgi:hypothetical protein